MGFSNSDTIPLLEVFLLFVSRKNAPLARMPPGEVDFEGDHGARLHGGNKGLLIVSQRQVVYGCVALFQR